MTSSSPICFNPRHGGTIREENVKQDHLVESTSVLKVIRTIPRSLARQMIGIESGKEESDLPIIAVSFNVLVDVKMIRMRTFTPPPLPPLFPSLLFLLPRFFSMFFSLFLSCVCTNDLWQEKQHGKGIAERRIERRVVCPRSAFGSF